MPENRRRNGKRVRKRRGLLTALLLSLAMVLLIFLDGLANWERVTDPVQEKGVERKDLYRPDDWSEEIVMESKTAIWYQDRVRYRFLPMGQAQLENLLRSWKRLSGLIPENTERYVVPIPPPVVFEEGCDADAAAYRELLRNLTEELDGEVIDLYPALEERSGEYTYYGEETALTNQGAYYAANQLLTALEGEALPPLENYDEELYHGSDTDPTYLYSLPGSKGYCQQFTVGAGGEISSIKKALLRKHEVGSGSVIASQACHWAVVEGDGEEETGTLLLIGDRSGKVLVPFLANHYRRVYYVNLEEDLWLGTEIHPVEGIFEKYDVKRVIYMQWAPHIGDQSWCAAMSAFMGQEGGTSDGESAG